MPPIHFVDRTVPGLRRLLPFRLYDLLVDVGRAFRLTGLLEKGDIDAVARKMREDPETFIPLVVHMLVHFDDPVEKDTALKAIREIYADPLLQGTVFEEFWKYAATHYVTGIRRPV